MSDLPNPENRRRFHYGAGRTGAVVAREIAKDLVDAEHLWWAKVTLAYAIGVEGAIMQEIERG